MAPRLPTTPDVEIRQRDLFYLLPGALICLAGVVLFHTLTLPEKVRGFFDYYPFLVLTGGLLLGWRFNRTRLIFALLILALADQALGMATDEPARRTAVAATIALIPLNLAMISFFVERGLLNRPGALRSGVIVAQPLLLALFHRSNPEALRNLFTQNLIDWAPLVNLPIPQIPLAALLLGGGILFVRFLGRPSAIDGGFLWTVVATVAPLAIGVDDAQRTLWFATAGLILTVSLIESSHRMAYRDELTGLPSRRALNEDLLKVGKIYTIAMVDVDHFKKVNDNHGHDVGDQVLKMVASHIDDVTGGGRPFRYGGEEFTVFFPGKTLREALPHLEDLRCAIERSGFQLRSAERPTEKSAKASSATGEAQRLAITVSIGVAERNSFNKVPAEVIKAADKALYKAKEEGRNRVCRAGGAA